MTPAVVAAAERKPGPQAYDQRMPAQWRAAASEPQFLQVQTTTDSRAEAVDLATGVLLAPDPGQMHTRSTSVAPDPDAPTPRWDRFLAQTFGGDEELLRYVQRMAGYSASGSVKWHILPFLHGPGGNGKGVFLNVMRALLGDYAATAPNAFLMAGGQRPDGDAKVGGAGHTQHPSVPSC